MSIYYDDNVTYIKWLISPQTKQFLCCFFSHSFIISTSKFLTYKYLALLSFEDLCKCSLLLHMDYQFVFFPELDQPQNLKSSITVKSTAVNKPKNIHYKAVKSCIIKKSPGRKYCKSRDSKSSILKPMYSKAVQPIFIKIRITQLLFLPIIKIFF